MSVQIKIFFILIIFKIDMTRVELGEFLVELDGSLLKLSVVFFKKLKIILFYVILYELMIIFMILDDYLYLKLIYMNLY